MYLSDGYKRPGGTVVVRFWLPWQHVCKQCDQGLPLVVGSGIYILYRERIRARERGLAALT